MPRRYAVRRPYSELSPADYKLFLAAMREDKLREYPIVGWQAIGEWLVRMQWLARLPHVTTLYRYRRYGMPVNMTPRPMLHGTKRQPWVTNLMLQAWIGTQGRALTLPRWHPFRQQVEKTYSQKPSAIRDRRHRARKRLATVKAKHALDARLSGVAPLSPGLKLPPPAPAQVDVPPIAVPAPPLLRRLPKPVVQSSVAPTGSRV